LPPWRRTVRGDTSTFTHAHRKDTFKDQRELDGMEAKILEAEARVAGLEAELSDPDRLRALGAETKTKLAVLDAAKKEVERLYERWAELGA
jgi:ATP-binding cassette subfamily F protein uup